MKIYRINPNCSELVVRLGDLTQGSPIEDVRAEIQEILNSSDIQIGLETQYWKGETRRSYFMGVTPDDIEYQIDSDGYKSLTFKDLPPKEKRGTLVRELELSGIESIVLRLSSTDSSASITYSGFGPEMVLMISDCDVRDFPLLAKVIRTMGYVWSPHDGGHGDGFENWCLSNGYEDVANMTW